MCLAAFCNHAWIAHSCSRKRRLITANACRLSLVCAVCFVVCTPRRYPPRGGMVILDSQYTDGGRIAAERFVAEEYIIDLLGAWDSHR